MKKTILLWVMISQFIVGFVNPSFAQTNDQPFTEDFKDANRWTADSLGTWSVSSGTYNQTSTATFGYNSTITGMTWNDATFDYDFKIVDNGGDPGNWAGIQIRKTEPADGFWGGTGYLIFATYSGNVIVFHTGKNQAIAQKATGLTFNKWTHIKVVAIGSIIQVYVADNIQPDITVIDDTFIGGYVSLITGKTSSSFDNVMITPSTEPVLSVSTASLSFGRVQIGNTSTPRSYTLMGSNLTSDVTVTAPNGFQVSQSQTDPYSSSLTLTLSGGSLTGTIWVKFIPTSETTYSGNVLNASSDIATQNLAVSGIGVTDLSQYELRVVGNQILNSNDVALRLTGVNIQGLENNPGGDHTIQAVTEAFDNWNSNVIRVTLSQEYWFGHSGADSTNYRNIVSQVVQEATTRNKFVILDLHWSDMGVWGQYNAQHKMPDDNSIIFWKSVCSEYGNNPTVLFGLYNEPNSITWEVWRDGGTVAENNVTYHTPGMQKMIQAVRDAGANNICVVGGLDWAYELTGIDNGYALVDQNTAGSVTGNGIVYDSHVYPWKNNWDYFVTRIADSYPILIGECGYLDRGGNEPYQTWTPKLLDWLDAHQYHWTGWALNPNNGPTLIKDWNFTPTTEWGAYAKPRLLSYDGLYHDSTTAVVTTPNASRSLVLEQNYPNPFNTSTRIDYKLSNAGHVTLTVLDIYGREVEILVDGTKEAGLYSTTFDGSRFGDGVYFVRLTSIPQDGSQSDTKTIKMMMK